MPATPDGYTQGTGTTATTRTAKPRGSFTAEDYGPLLSLILGMGSGGSLDYGSFFQSLLGGSLDSAPFTELRAASDNSPFLGLTDVRTPTMKATEGVGALQTLQSLLDPQWLSRSILGQTGGVPSRQGSGAQGLAAQSMPLLNMLFGTGAGAGGQPWQAPGGQTRTDLPGGSWAGGGGGQPPFIPNFPPQPPVQPPVLPPEPPVQPPVQPPVLPPTEPPGAKPKEPPPTGGTGGGNDQGTTQGRPNGEGTDKEGGDNVVDNSTTVGPIILGLLSALTSGALQARAGGGVLDPRATTIVGERGPEAITPAPGGLQVMPLNPMDASRMLQMGSQGMATGGLLELNDAGWTPPGGVQTMGAAPQQQPTQTPAPANSVLGGPGTTITENPYQPPQTNPGTFSGANQPAGGAIGQALGQNPEIDAFNQILQAFGQNPAGQAGQAFDTGSNWLQGLLGQNPGQDIMGALQPIFQDNLSTALGQLSNTAPSVHSSASRLAGTDLSRQALQDFNLLSTQAMQQGVNQQLQGLGTLGQLGQGASAAGQGGANTLVNAASAAGQNPFSRLMGAGQLGLQQQGLAEQARQFNSQFDLAAQQQLFNQLSGPTLQLLLAAMGLTEPTGYQTVVGSNKA